jgi:hypothetical protein
MPSPLVMQNAEKMLDNYRIGDRQGLPWYKARPLFAFIGLANENDIQNSLETVSPEDKAGYSEDLPKYYLTLSRRGLRQMVIMNKDKLTRFAKGVIYPLLAAEDI